MVKKTQVSTLKEVGMNEKERQLLDQLLLDRIQMILEEKIESDGDDGERITDAERIIGELPALEKTQVEWYVQRIIDQMAEEEELLYKSGVYDGIRIMEFLKKL